MDHELRKLLQLMYDLQASDLLLTVGSPPKLRVNGVLESVDTDILDPHHTRHLAYSVLDGSEVERLEAQRHLDFSREVEDLARFRFNIFYQKDAISVVARLIPFIIPGFDELGVPDVVRDFAMRPHGLVLVTGPAGSGKSTTQAAMIDYINRTKGVHIICLEDPIEYLHQHRLGLVAQREIGTDARNFTEALRCVFRQTPDVIMIGEMRDLETMELALTLSETGHLILGTLHTQDTTHSITRVVDMFPANQQEQVYAQLSMVLQGVISQQLLPSQDGARRVLACEVLNVNHAVRNLIREGEVQQVYSVIQTGRNEGMMTMNESLLHLCSLSMISQEVALRRSPRPKELMKMLEYEKLLV